MGIVPINQYAPLHELFSGCKNELPFSLFLQVKTLK